MIRVVAKAGPLIVVLLFWVSAVVAAQQSPRYHDIAVPVAAGDYPVSPDKLTDMRNFEKTADLRKHAWALFSGINAPSGSNGDHVEPIWTTWYMRSEAFGNGCSKSAGTQSSTRFEFELPMEVVANFEARGRRLGNVQQALQEAVAFFSRPSTGALRSAVLYNKAACEHIFGRKLFSIDILSDKFSDFKSSNTPPEEMEIDEFPRGSIVVKSSWLRIDAGGATVCLWSPSDSATSSCQPLGMQELRVEPASGGVPCRIVRGQPIPTSCFYSIRVTPLNVAEISRSMTVEPGDVLVLVGLHVITKEIEDWVWSTFWWQRGPDSQGFAADRPPSLFKAPWDNYAMDVTLSMETPHEKANVIVAPAGKCLSRGTSNAKICFNPYLEGDLDNGEYSNCMNCHKQATFQRLVPDPSGTVQRGFIGSDFQCFADKDFPVMREDYLWTLSPLPSDSPLKKFLDLLQQSLKLTSQLKSRPGKLL